MIEVVDVMGVDKDVILKALTANIKDFEDAVQSSAAETNEIDTIITRNKPDFSNSRLNIYTPKEFIENQR